MQTDLSTRTYTLAFIAIVFGASAIRLVWLVVNPHEIVADEIQYHSLALRLSRGEAYGVPFWPPGYPLVLSLVYRLLGPTVEAGLLLNFGLALLLLVLTGWIANRLFGQMTALLSLTLMAVMPSYIFPLVLIRYEILLQCLLALGVWLSLPGRLPAQQERWTWPRTLAIAAIAALATLMRPLWLLLPVVLWLGQPRRLRAAWDWVALKRVVAAQMLAVLLILPWIVYASLAADRLVPVALNGGINLWIGNNPDATGAYMSPPGEFWQPQNEDEAAEEAIRYMLNNPLHVLSLLPRKLWFSLNRDHWGLDWVLLQTRQPLPPALVNALRLASGLAYWPMLLAAVGSAALLIRRGRARRLWPLLLVIYSVASQLPFFGSPRFRWTTQFLLIIYAAALLPRLRAQNPRGSSDPPGLPPAESGESPAPAGRARRRAPATAA